MSDSKRPPSSSKNNSTSLEQDGLLNAKPSNTPLNGSSAEGIKKQRSSSARRDGRADHVLVRNLFAFAIVRRMVILVFFAAICSILSIISALQVIKIKTPPQYIQLTQDGRIFPIAPLSEDSVSDGEILKFSAESVKWVNTFDYMSWKDQLQSSASRFTADGWNNYLTQLVASDNLNSVESQHMVVNVLFRGNPNIVKEGVVKSIQRYTWLVEIPVTVRYVAPSKGSSTEPNITNQSGVVRLYITRVPLEVNLRGYAIQIYQFDTSEATK